MSKTATRSVISVDKYVQMGAGTVIDMAAGGAFAKTITGATTLTVTNLPQYFENATILIELTNGGSAVITWTIGTIRWPGGIVPTFTTAGKDIVVMYTNSNGVFWDAVVVSKDSK